MEGAMEATTVKLPVVYSRDAVLDIAQLAAGLGVSVRTAERMDLPSFLVGVRSLF